MSTTGASLLYHPCTVTYYHANHGSFSHREWKPACRLGWAASNAKWQGRYRSVCSSRRRTVTLASAASGAEATTEPSIGDVVSELEAEDAKPKTTPTFTRSRTFTVREDELVPEKVLVGKVKSIATYGAFVDMGARIDGLLHISKIGEGFIRNIEDVLKVGQEVKVQILDADIPRRRVSLKLFDPIPAPPPSPSRSPLPPRATTPGAPGTQGQGGREAFRGKIAGRSATTAQARTARSDRPKSKYEKGQEVTGVVKNLTRRGCFVQLPGEEEGFLASSEISEGGDGVPIETLVKSGQEVKVKVLRIVDGRVNLTMKQEFDLEKINQEFNENIVATNPFELAFRKSAVLRKYLEQTGKLPTPESKAAVTKGEVVVEVDGSQELDEAEKEAEIEAEADPTVAAQAEVEAAASEPEVSEAVASEPELTEAAASEPEVAEVAPSEPEVIQAASTDLEVTEAASSEPEAAPSEPEVIEALEVPEAASSEPEAASSEPEAAPSEPEVIEALEVPEAASSEPEAAPSEPEVTEAAASEPEVTEAAEVKPEPVVSVVISATVVKQLREQSGAGMMDCKKALMETNGDLEKAVEYLRKKGLAGADKKASRIAAEGAIGSYVHDSRIGVLLEVNSETDFVSRGEIFTRLVEDLGMQVAASQQVEYVSVDDIPAEMKAKETEIEMQREDIQSKPEAIRGKIVEGRVTKRLAELALLEQPFIKNDSILVKDLVKQTIAAVGEKIQVRRFTRYVLGEGLEKRSYDIAAEVAAQTEAKKQEQEQQQQAEETTAPAPSSEEAVSVSAALVKQLREETGTGMMDCKKALVESQGDFEKAKEYLRKKGLASAEKKAGRIAAEGVVVSYVHTGRIGVLLEMNSETDFVARNSVFKELADDLAMQVVACPLVEYVSVEDVPEEVKIKEREIEMQREDLQSKAEQIRGRIVEGRLTKLLAERCLLEQPFLKDDSILIKDLLKKTTTSLGENVRVRRFARYTLGEGIEKKNVNFAQEVADQVNALTT